MKAVVAGLLTVAVAALCGIETARAQDKSTDVPAA
jgi:hypothetical protein